jgi:hypothetical protein
MRRYYLHTRKGIYYAELVTLEGHKLTARSTGKTTKMVKYVLLKLL